MIASFSRVKKVREAMQNAGIDIYLMENTDPHQSEYLPDHWKEVEWISGFRGDVAVIAITQKEARLWTDSRFFISGAEQLKGTPFELMKMKVAGVPTLAEWIATQKKECGATTIGACRQIFFQDIEIDQDVDLVAPLWKDRPSMPDAPIEIYPEEYAGESTRDRLNRICDAIEAEGGQELFLSSLDDIAWALNLRGSDVMCTPVFTAYALIRRDQPSLFIDERKVTPEVKQYLDELGVEVKSYDEGARLAASGTANSCQKNPIPLMKAIKNEVEISGFRSAMLKDGIALTRFYHWLEDQLQSIGEFTILPDGSFGISNEVTESDCINKLIEFRKEQPLYREESFPAIVAWNEHGAMPHYETTAESNVPIAGNGLLLIDTGGQYLDGTTDITRTIGVGNVSDAMKRDYTLVLKGHIRLARAVFPRGTRGDQLDALARMDLWREGKTYRHGTSHGVGHYLGVHEGPQSVRMEHNPQQLLDGMFFSNEPAIYLGGKYGIRHENCVLVRPFDPATEAPDATPCEQEEQGEFQCLETLTLCYIDTTCIVREIMNPEEMEWLNNYNKQVYDTLAPHLNDSDRDWLKQKCEAI